MEECKFVIIFNGEGFDYFLKAPTPQSTIHLCAVDITRVHISLSRLVNILMNSNLIFKNEGRPYFDVINAALG